MSFSRLFWHNTWKTWGEDSFLLCFKYLMLIFIILYHYVYWLRFLSIKKLSLPSLLHERFKPFPSQFDTTRTQRANWRNTAASSARAVSLTASDLSRLHESLVRLFFCRGSLGQPGKSEWETYRCCDEHVDQTDGISTHLCGSWTGKFNCVFFSVSDQKICL